MLLIFQRVRYPVFRRPSMFTWESRQIHLNLFQMNQFYLLVMLFPPDVVQSAITQIGSRLRISLPWKYGVMISSRFNMRSRCSDHWKCSMCVDLLIQNLKAQFLAGVYLYAFTLLLLISKAHLWLRQLLQIYKHRPSHSLLRSIYGRGWTYRPIHAREQGVWSLLYIPEPFDNRFASRVLWPEFVVSRTQSEFFRAW